MKAHVNVSALNDEAIKDVLSKTSISRYAHTVLKIIAKHCTRKLNLQTSFHLSILHHYFCFGACKDPFLVL